MKNLPDDHDHQKMLLGISKNHTHAQLDAALKSNKLQIEDGLAKFEKVQALFNAAK